MLFEEVPTRRNGCHRVLNNFIRGWWGTPVAGVAIRFAHVLSMYSVQGGIVPKR